MKSLTFEEARELFYSYRSAFSFLGAFGIKYTIFGFAANIFPADAVSVATNKYVSWLECRHTSAVYQNKPIPFKTQNYDWRKV